MPANRSLDLPCGQDDRNVRLRMVDAHASTNRQIRRLSAVGTKGQFALEPLASRIQMPDCHARLLNSR